MSSQPTRSHVQPHTAPRLDVVPDYEKLLILDRSDESLFEAVDLEQNQNQDALHSLSGANHCPHARSRSSTGNSPSSTIMKSSSNHSSANASPTRQPLHDGNGPSNRERQASNSLAPAPVRLAQAQVSLSWTDILRPLMDDDSHRLDKITAPLGVQNQPPQATSPSSGEDNLQDLTSSGHSKLSASAPASRAGTIRRDRSRSPSRDRAHSHATQQPPSTVLGVMADGRVASPKVSTRRERSPSTWASPDASLTQDLQPTLMTKTRQQHQQQPSQNLAQWQQQQQRQQSGSLTAESRTQGVISSDRDQYQQQQMAANRIVGTASTQNPLLLSDDSNNSSPPSPTSSRRDYPKEIQPKVDTWRVESPTARRRAQEAAEREAQRQREEQAQREMEEFHRQQLERMREAERRRKVDAETHVCSLDFLVSVGSEAKQPEEPPSPTVKQVQPKVDTWWREGRPRSPTMERANRPQLAALSNSLQQSAPLPATSNSSAQAGESTTSPSRTRKTWGTVAASSVGTSNTNRNASIDDGDSGARQQQQSPTKSWGGQQQSQQAQLAQMQATRQHQPAVQRPPSPQQSRQTLARPPSPSQPRAAMGNKLTVNVNNTSEQSNTSSPPSPNRKPRSPRPANLTIETTQHPTLSRQPPQQQQAASPPKSASLSRASARKVASQLSESLDSAIVASATSPATRALPSRSRTTSANATTVSQLDESHGPTRAFLQRQSQNSLNDHGAAPPSPTSAKRQASSTLLVPQSPGGTLQRSRKSSSASVNNVSFANGAGDSLAAMLRKQQRELGTVTNMGGAGGPPAVLTIQARSWRSYLMHEGAYVALLAVFLLMAFETLAGDYGRGYKVGCIKTARHLSNTGEVVCHD